MVLAFCLSSCGATIGSHIPLAIHTNGRIGPGIVPAQLVLEPNEGVRPLTRAINKALDHIFVECYILTDSRVVHALERAATEGVRVLVMLEHHPFGMGDQPVRMAMQLRAAGVDVRWTPGGYFLTHSKFLVLDDRLVIVSTANLSRSAFSRNREFLVFDGRPLDVHEVSNIFRADWNGVPAVLGDQDLVVAPDDGRTKLQALIRSARTTIDVYGEELTDGSIERTFIRMSKRGVVVRVLLPLGSALLGAASLRTGGVQVRELGQPYVHAKVICVDNREAFVGSENMSSASLDHNREVGVLLRGAALRRIEAVFSVDWLHGRTGISSPPAQ